MFVHALNRGRIPTAPRTIDLCLYTHDTKMDTC